MDPENQKESITRKSGMVYTAVLALAITLISFLLVGLLLDRWLKTEPWLVVAGVLIGSVTGFYEFIKLMSRS